MADYTELAQHLRDDNAWKNCDFDFIYGWMHEAADAIEELNKEAQRWQAEAKDWYLAYMDLLPEPPKEET